MHFIVLGVSEKKGSVFGNSQDEFVLMPLGAFQRLFGSRRSLEITVKPAQPELVEPAMDAARVALRVKRHLRPRDDDNFGMYTSDTLMDLWKTFSQGAFSILIGVVSLSLVVGGIVIMNIMLMVVSERTREIGLRKALGAKRRDIVWQILTESTTLSMVGGLLGTLFGFGVAMLVVDADAASGAHRALVGAARPRHDGHRRHVLRPVSGDARRLARSDRSAAGRNKMARRASASGSSPKSSSMAVDTLRDQQAAVGADGARRGHRRHVDRRHDLAHPRLRRPVRGAHQPARRQHRLRREVEHQQLRQREGLLRGDAGGPNITEEDAQGHQGQRARRR